MGFNAAPIVLAPLVLLCFLLWCRELTRVFNFSVSTAVQIPILYKGTQMFLDSVHFPLVVVDILIFSTHSTKIIFTQELFDQTE